MALTSIRDSREWCARPPWVPTHRPCGSALRGLQPTFPRLDRRRRLALPLVPELLELVLEPLQLVLRGVLQGGEGVPGLAGAPDELVELEVQGRRVPVLGGLDEEHHEERHHRRPG